MGYMEFKSQFYGLSNKIKNGKNIGFIFNQIVKLTIKNYSSLSNINICYHLKFTIPIINRKFFRLVSQKPQYVKRFCNDS